MSGAEPLQDAYCTYCGGCVPTLSLDVFGLCERCTDDIGANRVRKPFAKVLKNQQTAVRAEVLLLEELVRLAYFEGFTEAHEQGPDVRTCWDASDAKDCLNTPSDRRRRPE